MPGDDVRAQNAGTSTGSPGFTGADTAGAGSTRKTGAARGAASQGVAGALGSSSDQTDQQSGSQGEGQQSDNVLNTALESGRKWIEDSGVLNSVNQLPQSVKDWSSRAATRVGDLTTTQKIVGGALLAVGIGYLATRKGKSEKSESRYGRQGGSSYGRRSGYGYQAPDASSSSRTGYSGSGRSDSGAAYGNSGSSYGSGSGNTGSSSGAGFGSSTPGGDFGSRTSESSYRSKNDDSRSVE